jgi:hypothetical protein
VAGFVAAEDQAVAALPSKAASAVPLQAAVIRLLSGIFVPRG